MKCKVSASTQNQAFNALLFPDAHPYHQPLTGDSATTAKLASARVRAFYDALRKGADVEDNRAELAAAARRQVS